MNSTGAPGAAPLTIHWPAELELAYARRGAATLPVKRRHRGPLRVQKHLYPEGPAVCQHLLLHPPGGIAGGDSLDIGIDLGEQAWVQLTSPGAAKWYAATHPARQQLRMRLQPGATLEWLPQESIIYSGAQAQISTHIELQEDARLLYWDTVALGRPVGGQLFTRGCYQAALDISRDGRSLWHERQLLSGDDELLRSPIGLGGQPVFATLIASGEISSALLDDCRRLNGPYRADLSQLPELLIGRCLAGQALQARAWLVDIWRLLRPALLGRDAVAPRIWST